HFRQKKSTVEVKVKLPLLERLPRYIIEGSKDGLVDDLNEVLKTMKPLEIVNGPLMAGMDEVGRLFNANQLIVAEVLQSAEAMKAAVAHLEPHMEKTESSIRGKVLLATVKGDVHDIGKNLVEIILANNGFQVVNLGIKVLPETLIQAIREHKPNIIGLSGLLVKSAQQMVVTAADFAKAGVETPMLVGGAALSSNFVDRQIAPAYTGTVAYASDAMSGLDLAKTIVDEARFDKFKNDLAARRAALALAASTSAPAAPVVETHNRSAEIKSVESPPQPPDFQRHVIRNTPIDQIWKFINPLMLYGRHLGVKGGVVRQLQASETDPALRRQLESTETKALSIWNAVQEVKDEFRGTERMAPSAVYQFFRAASEGNKLLVYPPPNGSVKPAITFDFPRQPRAEGLCLADYTTPLGKDAATDNIALFLVSIGKGVRLHSEELKNRGDYLKSHILQALALESAEAYAEMLHSQLRRMWGIPDTPKMTMMERFQAKYHGKRYSFGYPACPRLDDQTQLFELLHPTELGVQLTDGFMMDPEASVSAIVFHHPQATYFSVGHRGTNDDNR
ncbi:MAG: B12-binding domain-containing protein, partial [Deltaproteobacteria bacterium]|nr:B12-binding domain-containing protein [Deltaproteobacteria bacterium]